MCSRAVWGRGREWYGKANTICGRAGLCGEGCIKWAREAGDSELRRWQEGIQRAEHRSRLAGESCQHAGHTQGRRGRHQALPS